MHLREYETIFILRPDMGEDAVAKIVQRVRDIIEQKEGAILVEENWGKKKLAYEVQKHLKGIYYYVLYGGYPGVVEEIERMFRMVETVIKFQTVKLSDQITVEDRMKEIAEEKRRREEEAKAAMEEARPERSRKSADDAGNDSKDDEDAADASDSAEDSEAEAVKEESPEAAEDAPETEEEEKSE